jgi:recombination protein RecA
MPTVPQSLLLGWRHAPTAECVSSGITEVDAALGGFPRGRVSEIVGPSSSGRTTLLDSILAAATTRGENCVLVDTRNAFDPPTAASRGVKLENLIWIRCSGNEEHALRAADLVLHSGGFGVVALDLAEVPAVTLRRIPSTSWFRFRRAVESTPTVFVVIANRPLTASCASLLLETRRRRITFLRGVDYEISPRKPAGREAAVFHVRLHPLAAG